MSQLVSQLEEIFGTKTVRSPLPFLIPLSSPQLHIAIEAGKRKKSHLNCSNRNLARRKHKMCEVVHVLVNGGKNIIWNRNYTTL